MVGEQVHAVRRALALVRRPRLEVREDARGVGRGVRAPRARPRSRAACPATPAAPAPRRPRRVAVGLVAHGLGPAGPDRGAQRGSRAPRSPAGAGPARAAHLGPVVEADAADLVRDAGPGERLLDRRELRVHPDQHRDLARGATPSASRARIQATSAASSCVGVAVARDRGQPGRRRASARGASTGPRPRSAGWRAPAPAAWTGSSGPAPRPARPASAPRTTGEERRRRAGERVDRLVLVAHDAQVARLAQPQLEQPLLERVGVLVLVDAEPPLARPDRRRGVGVALEQVDGPEQQVVEVDPPGPRLRPLVARRTCRTNRSTGIGGSRPAAAAAALVVARRDPPRLRPLDLVGEVLRRREPVVAGELAREPAEDRRLGVEQLRQRRAVVAQRPEEAQLAQRVGVERARRDARQARAPRSRSTISPAALSVNVTTSAWSAGTDARRDRVRRPAADDPRLAACRPPRGSRPARSREDRLALLGVEVVRAGRPGRAAAPA